MGNTFKLGKLVNGLTVLDNGNVGIGTASPSQLLEVVGGEIKAGRVDSSYEGGQVSFGRSTDNATAWYIDVYGNTSTPALRFLDVSNSSERMRIASDGKVGIGTSNPLTKIDCQISTTGTVTENAAFRDSSTNGNALQIWNGNNESRIRAVYYGTASDQNITFWTITSAGNQGERMRIGADGKVGIGTNSPQSLFDVTNVVNTAYDSSNTLTSGQTMRISNTSTTSGVSANLLFIATGAGGGNGLGSISGVNTGTGSLSLTFGTRDSGGAVAERMRITNYASNTTLGNGGVMKLLGTSGSVGAYTELQFYTYNAPSNQPPVSIGIVKTDNGGYENGELYIATKSSNANNAPIERVRVTNNGVFKFSNVPYNNYHLDTAIAISIANGGTIPFETFSGLIIINNMSNGNVGMWLVGAGSVSLVGQAYNANIGSMSYSVGINGYIWTSNYGSTSNYGVFAVRTRANA